MIYFIQIYHNTYITAYSYPRLRLLPRCYWLSAETRAFIRSRAGLRDSKKCTKPARAKARASSLSQSQREAVQIQCEAERGFLVSDGAKRWKRTEWPSIPAVRYVCRGGGAAEGHGGLLYLPYKTQALFPTDFGEKKCVLYSEKYGNFLFNLV